MTSLFTSAAILQQFEPGAEGANEANAWFYTVFIWLIVLLPVVLAIVLAAAKKKSKPPLPHVTDFTWELDVTGSELPILVHAYHSWSIGDRVIENQVDKLRDPNEGRLRVLWLDIEKNPGVVGRYPTLEEKSVALFVGERLVRQAQGVHDHVSIQLEIEPFLPAFSAPREAPCPDSGRR